MNALQTDMYSAVEMIVTFQGRMHTEIIINKECQTLALIIQL